MTLRADRLWFGLCAFVHLAVATRLTDGVARTQFDGSAFAHFFDFQAQALLRGDLALEEGAIGLESFVVDGSEHMYFGLWPALARMPILSVTDRFFGDLTVMSSFLAWLLFVGAAWSLTDRVASSDRASDSASLVTPWLLTVWKLGVALGTPMLMLAGTAWVFNEAIMWGVASCVWFQDRLVAELRSSSTANQAWLSAALLLAVLNRPTLGLGCVVVTVGVVLVRSRRRLSSSPGDFRLAGAAAVAGTVLVIPNLLRFGRLFGPPMDRQGLSMFDEHRMRMLEYTGGDYVDPRFAPTNVLAYLRPDGVSVGTRFPFVEAPRAIPTQIGEVIHDITYRTPSLSASTPLLMGLALVGAILVVRSSIRRDVDDTSWHLVACALTGVPGAAALFVWGFIAPRYLADFVPVLLPLALVGLVALGRRLDDADVGSASLRWLRAGVVIVAAWSVVASLGIALSTSYQKGYDGDIAEYVSLRGDDPWVGAVRFEDQGMFEFERADPPPAGTIAVLGDCEASYFSTGEQVDPWLDLGMGPNDFRQVFEVSIDVDAPDGSVELARMASVEPAEADVPDSFTVRLVIEDGDVRIDLTDRFGFVPYDIDDIGFGDSFELTIASDPVRKVLTFASDGEAFGFGHVFTRSLYGPSGQSVSFASSVVLDGVQVSAAPVNDPC